MIEKLKGADTLKRKAKVIGEIATESFIAQVENPNTYIVAGGVALVQGMIYGKEVGKGILAGTSVLGAIVGANIVCNLISNREMIKEA